MEARKDKATKELEEEKKTLEQLQEQLQTAETASRFLEQEDGEPSSPSVGELMNEVARERGSLSKYEKSRTDLEKRDQENQETKTKL